MQAEKQHKALPEIRAKMESEDGKKLYQKPAGVEGTISQGVRAFGPRQTRYIWRSLWPPDPDINIRCSAP
jgi:transposase